MTNPVNLYMNELKSADKKYKELQKEGWHFWASYSAENKAELDHALENHKIWSNRVKTLKYPNGATIVFYKHASEK